MRVVRIIADADAIDVIPQCRSGFGSAIDSIMQLYRASDCQYVVSEAEFYDIMRNSRADTYNRAIEEHKRHLEEPDHFRFCMNEIVRNNFALSNTVDLLLFNGKLKY